MFESMPVSVLLSIQVVEHMKEMDQRELESELQNMMKLHAEGVKQVKKMERIVRESDQRAKVNITNPLKTSRGFFQPLRFFGRAKFH